MSPSIAAVPESPYRRWVRSEGLDIVSAHYVPELAALPLRRWERTGGDACVINHSDSDRSNDCRVVEIPAGGRLAPQRHLHELMVYVLSGHGTARVWQASTGVRQSFEWDRGSLFAIPLNAWYELFNVSGDEPVRLVTVTNAPAVMNMFVNPEFVFGSTFEFLDRFDGAAEYFDGEGTLTGRYLATNFVPDIRTLQLVDHSERGAGATNIGFDLAGNTMRAHVSEFPVGTYKKAHRHEAGAHVIILTGSGYSLMWKEGEPFTRYDWFEGTMITPPADTFHQHFNTGPEPARYLALRHEFSRNVQKGTGLPLSMIDMREGGDQIGYPDERPEIRQMYQKECELTGAEYQMSRIFGT